MKLSRPGVLRLICSAGLVTALSAQPAKPAAPKTSPKAIQAQAPSTFTYTPGPDGSSTIDIRNIAYEVTGSQIPGRPGDDRLVLRKTIASKQVVGDIGMESTITLDAWRLGDDIKQKPIYTLSATGVEGHIVDSALFVAARGVEEVEWWSAYKLGTGQHLFDTYVPLLSFSISRDVMNTRYVGLEVPPDDTKDARLKAANVVGVLTYASEDKVIREVMITCDDTKRARLLRSYADVTRTISAVTGTAVGKSEPSRTIKLSFSENYPSPPNTVEILIPVLKDDLDLAHVQAPAKLHVGVWRR